MGRLGEEGGLTALTPLPLLLRTHGRWWTELPKVCNRGSSGKSPTESPKCCDTKDLPLFHQAWAIYTNITRVMQLPRAKCWCYVKTMHAVVVLAVCVALTRLEQWHTTCHSVIGPWVVITWPQSRYNTLQGGSPHFCLIPSGTCSVFTFTSSRTESPRQTQRGWLADQPPLYHASILNNTILIGFEWRWCSLRWFGKLSFPIRQLNTHEVHDLAFMEKWCWRLR